METCSRCNVRWFQMGLATQGDDIGVCKPCIKDAKSLNNPTLPLLFSDANELDPGLVPEDLPILTGVEEIMIARVYVHLQVIRKADFDASRTRSVTLAAYAKHMLKYKDGRFGRHPLFRYYVFNRIMRDQALSATRFLCNQSDESRLSLDELNDLIGGNRGEQFLNKIVRHARKIKGTRPY